MSPCYYYMNNKKGVELTCHKCGATIFLKRLQPNEFVKGALVPEVYEQPPEGWSVREGSELCPTHAKEYDDMVRDIMNGKFD